MPWRIISGFVALLVLTNAQQNGGRVLHELSETPTDNMIDIDVETEKNSANELSWYDDSGSGSGMETDDEDLVASGSGSGAAAVPDFTDTTALTRAPPTTPYPAVPTSTTRSPLSPCEQLRDSSKHLLGNYIPRCTPAGDYDSVQCRGFVGTGNCWCADRSGREIPGTALGPPHAPDCDGGNNLPPCVFMLVKQSRKGLMGTFRPRCSVEGNFEQKQCLGSMCYCVYIKTGVKVDGTEVFLPDQPKCDGMPQMGRTTPEKGIRKETVDILLNQPATPMPGKTTSKSDMLTTTVAAAPVTKQPSTNPKKEPSTVAHVMTQPGILAAIIGGSVVLLLCAILLVMFVVYRMRKKDEGSYALDEPKKMPNYSYQRAPDKEFYA